VTIGATLSDPEVTPGVAGAQNDFAYDSSKIAVQAKQVCKADPTTECMHDSDCEAGDTCIEVPDCTVNSAIKKEATAFAFLPPDCAGTACTGVRVIVFSLQSPNRLIPDGALLYTCPVNIAVGTPNGDYPLTISNVVLSFPSPPGGQVPGATGLDGVISVGVPTPTPTNTTTPTNTQVPSPTNTAPPIDTPTSTPVVSATPSATQTRTRTPVGPTATPTRTVTATVTSVAAVTGIVAQDASAGATTLVLLDAGNFGSSGTIVRIGDLTLDIGYTRLAGSNTLNLDSPLPANVLAGTTVEANPSAAPQEDGCGCRIATPDGTRRTWLLIAPVVGLLLLRRRYR
jgi:MYXO-CTERM domain-containing protein